MTKALDDFWPDDEDYNPDPDTLCPQCVADVIDPASWYGFCRRCSENHAKNLKSSRQQRWAPQGWRRVQKATG